MSQEIEIEFKTLLTETDYLTLIADQALTEDDFFSQTNSYYDTPNFDLKKQGMGLRIRLREAQAELTLKSPLDDQVGLLETTDYLPLDLAESLVKEQKILSEGNVADFLMTRGIAVDQLVTYANLTTKRAEVQLTPETLLVLDESWYHGKHDYELEMEVTEAATGQLFFDNFLKKNAIVYQPAKNKVQRAFEANQVL